jgi:hypothetical protein
LQQQLLVNQTRYIGQQPRPFVVLHGDRTSYVIWRRIVRSNILTIRGIELVLGDGRKLRIRQGVDEETLRSVLAALEPPRC